MPSLSVIIPTHSPDSGRLRRTLRSLRDQTLPATDWETVLVDNASTSPVDPAAYADDSPANLRVVCEPTLGLSHARRRGFTSALGAFIILVDDDNLLSSDYLTRTLARFDAHPKIGALGGVIRPEFEREPAAWQREFFPLLALRDLGPDPVMSGIRPPGATRDTYPPCAPVGAGMALRRSAVQAWLDHASHTALTDRRGKELTSGGDNDIVIALLRAGWDVGYFPDLALTHLIPASRLAPAYLARLNRGIQKSWMQVLLSHGLSTWSPIPGWTVPLRRLKAWFTYRAWSGPAAHIRWQGACGHFEGRVA